MYIGVVIAAGVIMAVPVERERRMRQRAEATSHRLALLNEIAMLTLTGDLRRTLDETLASLVGVLGLDAACVAATDPDDPARMTFLARYPSQEGSLETCLARVDPLVDTGHVRLSGDNVLVVAFDTNLPDSSPAGRVTGLLGVQVSPALQLGPDDHRLLVGVANQLATALANDRLKTLERDRVRSYARLVTWAQEEERKRISRELHDEAAQNLVAIRRDLDALSSSAADGAKLEELRALASRTLAGLRRFSRDLRPPVLDDLGLQSALDALVADIGQQNGPTARLTVEGVPRRLAGDRELMLFRIGQAALNNVLRHAKARSASVELAFLPDRVRLTIIDDGVGFDPPDDVAELAAGGKLGLLGMRERAELANAQLTIASAWGEGTRITVETAD